MFYLIDKQGLLVKGQKGLNTMQASYARTRADIEPFVQAGRDGLDLLEVIEAFKPTILIGTSGVSGAFSKKVVTTMAKHVELPAILPLSNPTHCAEVVPEDLIAWTNGHVLIATGSPFDPVVFDGRTYSISQCNNALAFPGIGVGAIISKSHIITDNMLYAASLAISKYMNRCGGSNIALLPGIEESIKLAKQVAYAVAATAIEEGVHTNNLRVETLEKAIESYAWKPHYMHYTYG